MKRTQYCFAAWLVQEILDTLDGNSFVTVYGENGEPEDEDNNDEVLAVSAKLRAVIALQDELTESQETEGVQ